MSHRKFTLDDFIGTEILGKKTAASPGKKIDPQSKLADFSEIKIEAIDPRIRSELDLRLKNIEQNLIKLKHLKT